MFQDNRIDKVEILINQKRYVEAQKLIVELLKEDASDIFLHEKLVLVNLKQDKIDQANTAVEHAIGLSPNNAYLFYLKCRICIEKDNLKDAEIYINKAIEIEPYSADYVAQLANIKFHVKQFEISLEIANRALQLEPDNLLALNTRSSALSKLNQKDESYNTIQGALREDPNNAYTHANFGWNLLENGDPNKALEHFKESLTINPNFEYAQSGMLEAIKAKNPIYRFFLKYTFWMSNMTSKYQWGVIIGFYLLVNGLKSVAKNYVVFEPFISPIVLILTIIAFSSWVITPISNLFLRFNKYGKLLLDKNEKMCSNFVALCLVIFLIGIISIFVLSDERFISLAVFGFAMIPVINTVFTIEKNKKIFIIYALIMALSGIISIYLTFLTGKLYGVFTCVFILGFVAHSWIANYLAIEK